MVIWVPSKPMGFFLLVQDWETHRNKAPGDGWVEIIFLKEKDYTPGSINIAGTRKAGF